MFKEYVEEKLKEARFENIKEVRNEIQSEWVKEKIINHCERFKGLFQPEQIIELIKSNDVVASFFAKDPLKQNIPEKECAKWIGADKLPASGKNCIRFNSKGEIVSQKGVGVSKSADFFKDGVYYTQKYTGNSMGGAQDNQYEDVITFLENGSINHKVGAIIDGGYWEDLGYRQKLEDGFKDNPNVVIVSADDLMEKK